MFARLRSCACLRSFSLVYARFRPSSFVFAGLFPFCLSSLVVARFRSSLVFTCRRSYLQVSFPFPLFSLLVSVFAHLRSFSLVFARVRSFLFVFGRLRSSSLVFARHRHSFSFVVARFRSSSFVFCWSPSFSLVFTVVARFPASWILYARVFARFACFRSSSLAGFRMFSLVVSSLDCSSARARACYGCDLHET